MRKHTHIQLSKYLSAGLSAALFAVFFMVQCISNFDVAYSTRLPAQIFARHDNGATVSKSHSTPETKINIRLNKRFQSTSIGFASKWPEPPVITYLEIVRQYYYYDSNLLSTVRLHESLRGPPVVVC